MSAQVAKTKPFMEKIYRYIFQRSATFVLAGVIGAFYMERAVDVICDNIFDKVNEGKQFHDLVKKLESEGKPFAKQFAKLTWTFPAFKYAGSLHSSQKKLQKLVCSVWQTASPDRFPNISSAAQYHDSRHCSIRVVVLAVIGIGYHLVTDVFTFIWSHPRVPASCY
ncbi:Cytochrome b-c1 complex subunit 9 [Trichinella sp. T9]|nr:Cytochrome b-c1 complex subunit 9 [Trichinella sp. T9]